MRQIKFRGLRTDGKGWAYGVPFYISGERKCFIIDNCQSGNLTQEDSVFDGKEVEYRSVGQFTGLHDKNGAEIYEGDMLKTEDSTYAYVVWEDAAFAMKSQGSEAVDWVHSSEYSKSEVIGNTHTQDGGQEG